MSNVIILGKTGMLGSMVEYYFKNSTSHKIYATARDDSGDLKFDAESQDDINSLSEFIGRNNIEYVINCIGIIKPYCKDDDPKGVLRAIKVNALFPHKLAVAAKKSNAKVIQIATDCVYSGKEGAYNEDAKHDALDVYGKSKSLGEVFDKSILNVRCSIIGPEKKGKVSLLEWFLGTKDNELKGFDHHKWNGITTLRYAKLVDDIITAGNYAELLGESHIHHFVPSYVVSKYDMLIAFKKVFGKDAEIKKVDNIGAPVDRTLSTRYDSLNEFSGAGFEEDLEEIKQVMDGGYYDS